MTDRELMQQALEALERYGGVDQRACDAEEALRERLAQPDGKALSFAWDAAVKAERHRIYEMLIKMHTQEERHNYYLFIANIIKESA